MQNICNKDMNSHSYICAIPGLGPKSSAALQAIGIHTAVEGVHWRDVQRQRRTEVLLRLDELGLAPK
jgi:hypothetical protein